MRFLLDQNFPVPLIEAMRPFMPPGIELVRLAEEDRSLALLDDDQLILEASRRGFDGLVTTDYHMLDDPVTVAAMVATKITIVAIEAAGHDPLKASGALFLELPGLQSRLKPNESNVFYIVPRPTAPRPAWDFLSKIGQKMGKTATELWHAFKPQ